MGRPRSEICTSAGYPHNCASRYSGRRGAGKTHVLKTIVKRKREILGGEASVFVATQTGDAASNVGCGATTLASLFKTMGESNFAPCVRTPPERCELLIADEISLAGAQKFAAMIIRSGGGRRTSIREHRSHPLWELSPTTANRAKEPNRADLGGEVSGCGGIRKRGPRNTRLLPRMREVPRYLQAGRPVPV